MSFRKAEDLMRLAEMAASRYGGVSLLDIEAEFGIDHRTAQRMTRALEDIFPDIDVQTDDSRRKFWRLNGNDLKVILSRGIRDGELSAIGIAIRRAEQDGAVQEVKQLCALRDRLLASMPRPHARRAEVDAEALLEAHGFAFRPGPNVAIDESFYGVIYEALKANRQIGIVYKAGGAEPERERRLEAYGLLLGIRKYLIAKEPDGRNKLQHFRLDRIDRISLLPDMFTRDPDFDLAAYAARAFGSFHSDDEYGEVVWRFSPEVSETVKEFSFHVDQTISEEPDGAVTVRFMASGHLEMAWYLYQWGDAVEVLEPAALRDLVHAYRRSDFGALP